LFFIFYILSSNEQKEDFADEGHGRRNLNQFRALFSIPYTYHTIGKRVFLYGDGEGALGLELGFWDWHLESFLQQQVMV
jgi:hypothetical protein